MYSKGVVTVIKKEKVAKRTNLSQADIAKVMEAFDSEKVPKCANCTIDEFDSESSDNDFDTNNQQINYKGSIQSKNNEIKWKLNIVLHSS
ncbi:hypothetical protein TNCV_414651 [Trichonephila clavipes]|nr:hypothetical protein TNCV_414651 [Trichonephila clavipes]